MEEVMMNGTNKFFYFAMNYPYGFIAKIWEGEDWLIKHLEDKFEHLYSLYGSYGAVMAFYGELDNSNRVKFLRWIMENYNQEIALKFEK